MAPRKTLILKTFKQQMQHIPHDHTHFDELVFLKKIEKILETTSGVVKTGAVFKTNHAKFWSKLVYCAAKNEMTARNFGGIVATSQRLSTYSAAAKEARKQLNLNSKIPFVVFVGQAGHCWAVIIEKKDSEYFLTVKDVNPGGELSVKRKSKAYIPGYAREIAKILKTQTIDLQIGRTGDGQSDEDGDCIFATMRFIMKILDGTIKTALMAKDFTYNRSGKYYTSMYGEEGNLEKMLVDFVGLDEDEEKNLQDDPDY